MKPVLEWLNRPGPYGQYCYADQNPRARVILSKYPFFFDDFFWYWNPKGRKDIIVRAPLWTFPCKSVPAEKAARKKAQSEKGQSRLK